MSAVFNWWEGTIDYLGYQWYRRPDEMEESGWTRRQAKIHPPDRTKVVKSEKAWWTPCLFLLPVVKNNSNSRKRGENRKGWQKSNDRYQCLHASYRIVCRSIVDMIALLWSTHMSGGHWCCRRVRRYDMNNWSTSLLYNKQHGIRHLAKCVYYRSH